MHDASAAMNARAQDELSKQQVIFHLRGTAFALPVRAVRSVLRMQELHPVPQAPSYVKGLITIRGRALAVVDLAQRLGLPRPRAVRGLPEATPTPNSRIMVLRVLTMWVGVLVDHVDAVDVFPEERIQRVPDVLPVPMDHRAITGIIHVDSHPVFLLDPVAALTPLDVDGSWLPQEPLPP